MIRYVHTNIIAKDAARLIAFYKEALACKSLGQTRDLCGPWLDKLTGLPQAHITGEHLLLPGYEADHPTLEIFSYHSLRDSLLRYLRSVQPSQQRLIKRGHLLLDSLIPWYRSL